MKLGIDIGSTTVKLVLLDNNDSIVFSRYERHMSNVFDKVKELIEDMYREYGVYLWQSFSAFTLSKRSSPAVKR